MQKKGLDLSTMPKARVVKAIASPTELKFAATTLSPRQAPFSRARSKRPRASADPPHRQPTDPPPLPVLRIAATDTYTPEALRAKLIADYKHAKSGPLPVEMA